jgi:hypothetical protein
MRKSLFSPVVVILLAACGGGGGGGSDSPQQSAGPLPITASNYQRVAQESASSTSYLVETYDLVVGAQVVSERVLLDFARMQAMKMPDWFKSQPLAIGADIVRSGFCSGGGTLSSTHHDTNNNQLPDVGETATVVATQCVELGVTFSGTIVLTLNSITGDLNATVHSASISMTLTNLSATAAAGSVSGNGSMTLDYAMTGVNTGTVSLAVPSLAMSGTIGGTSYTRSLQDFRISTVLSPFGQNRADAVTVSGTISGSALDGKSVTLATVSPVVQVRGSPYPNAGQVTATGLGGSKMRLTVQSATTVQIELDADGNGAYETSVTKPWSELI